MVQERKTLSMIMSLNENLYESIASGKYESDANVAYDSFNLASSKTANHTRERFSRSTFVKLMILLLLGIALCGCLIFLLVETFKLKSKVASLEEKCLSCERNFTTCNEENVNLPLQTPPPPSPCGGAGWRPVVNLNMADPSQDCPSPWIETLTPVRSCNKSTFAAGCDGVSFTVSGGPYSHVCGRAVGYGRRSPDAFTNFTGLRNGNINDPYLDGVSVTYGSPDMPRQHIWSFAAGHYSKKNGFRCPCDNSTYHEVLLPPPFVGDNYFCDSNLNGSRALWDGEDCTTACCTFNSPPYFTTTLPAPTSDDIEVRLCRDQDSSDEDISVTQIQIFVTE